MSYFIQEAQKWYQACDNFFLRVSSYQYCHLPKVTVRKWLCQGLKASSATPKSPHLKPTCLSQFLKNRPPGRAGPCHAPKDILFGILKCPLGSHLSKHYSFNNPAFTWHSKINKCQSFKSPVCHQHTARARKCPCGEGKKHRDSLYAHSLQSQTPHKGSDSPLQSPLHWV